MAVALLSPGLREDFSLISDRDLEERSAGGWESPRHDNWRDPGESDSDSEQQEDSMEEPFDGVLHEGMVSDGLSVLGRSAPGTEQVYLHLTISDKKLNDIKILCNYAHLQKLDVSGNEVCDLSCVSYMPYLTELNASNNKLTTFFDFVPPKNLMVVNLSFNQITDMKDLSVHKALTTLLLNDNNIQEIIGLEKCISLTHLNLAHNSICNICEFGNLPIKTLNLASNQIRRISGLEDLKRLQCLDLSSNQLSSLEGLEGLELVQTLNLEDNEICQISEIAFIEELPLLHVLNLLNNPVQEQAEYWLSVLFMLQRLTELDMKKIKVEEKVAAVNKYDPPPEVIASRDHMANVMYSTIQPQKILDSTLPNLDTAYPMLVLTGPQSCGKRELAHRMCRDFKEFFRYGPCHTTRNPYFGEEKGFDFHFVTPEIFENMTCSGLFLLTLKYSGHYYGLSIEAVESVAREGLACCTHMEIEGVRSLKNSYFKPRYILLLPLNKEKYEGWLRRKGLFSRAEIDVAVSRVDMYVKIQQDCPGYFDAVINTDDLDEAYGQLRLLVKEYLGLTEPGQSSQSLTRAKSGTDSGKPFTESSPNEATKESQNYNNDFQDSTARNYSARISAKVSPQKTPAEEASVQRRQQATRQALAGKTPGTYTQLFQRGPLTAPATLGTHRRLLDPASCSSMKPSGSNVTADRSFPPVSPETSSRDSRASSGLSLLSSAGAFSVRRSSSQPTPVINIQSPPEERVEPLDLSGIRQELDSFSGDQKSFGTTPDTPRLPSSNRSDVRTLKSKSCSSLPSAHSSRPGSNTKPILPPIPSGHKKSPI
ncbi:PREDICTED: leucine-rich repeat and guanylate kinase domain-containing protein [Nanorana parkeri]|uniref:leucine-rich repeat and guanylate kinase domain-containing protein n=1 Tax=Nanorana parkeri TaxID=125878 RepID=UPI0008550500|nr:PREDICTED: leucine-rich repeat and guanylate kinase domain-containing protein [Nanorana parkeri]